MLGDRYLGGSIEENRDTGRTPPTATSPLGMSRLLGMGRESALVSSGDCRQGMIKGGKRRDDWGGGLPEKSGCTDCDR